MQGPQNGMGPVMVLSEYKYYLLCIMRRPCIFCHTAAAAAAVLFVCVCACVRLCVRAWVDVIVCVCAPKLAAYLCRDDDVWCGVLCCAAVRMWL